MGFYEIKDKINNNKNLITNMIGSVCIKGFGLILSLFMMPAYIRFFNNDVVLGLWFTILSVLNWLLYFDFGIGNGLRNCLTKSLAMLDQDMSKKYVSSAYIAIGSMCIMVIILYLPLSKIINWHTFFNLSSTSVSKEALWAAVSIVFLGIVLQLFFRLINSVLYAIQKAAINNVLNLISSLLQVVALYILPSSSNNKNIINMALIHLLAVILPMIIASVIMFTSKQYRYISPSIRCFDVICAKEVLSLGGAFLIAQIMYMVIMNTNDYLITWFVGSSEVVNYQVYYKIYTIIATLFVLLLTPLWSALTKALAEKNFQWINSIYRIILLIAIMCTVFVFCLIPLTQSIVDLWLGENAIEMTNLNGISFAALASVIVFNTVFSTFANGFGQLKPQIICYTVGAILKVPFAYAFVLLSGSWIGVVWSNSLVLVIYCIVEPFFVRKTIRGQNMNL